VNGQSAAPTVKTPEPRHANLTGMKQTLSIAALVVGALFIWIAWWLMPDAATNDATAILAAVSGHRASVRASALVQLAGAALLVPGLLGELLARPGARRAGTTLVLLGAAGMAADAVHHQLAYEMTAPGLALESMAPVMIKMQTEELRPLVPLLLAFVVGAVVLGWQRRRDDGAWRWSTRALVAPIATLPLGIVLVRGAHLPRRLVVLTVLAEICVGLAALGTRGRGAIPPKT
jgi:hypothetical protein